MTVTELLLVTARALHLAASMSLAGALVFRLMVAPFPLHRVLRPSLAVALVAGAAWLAAQAVTFGGGTFPIVATGLQTRFGRVLLLRLLLLALAAWLAWRPGTARLVAGCLVALAAVALHVAVTHAGASEDPMLMGALAVHLLAGAAWLGGLAPLVLALRGEGAELAARRFSWLGIACVAALLATALAQGVWLVGGLPGLVGTRYGWVALNKSALYLLMLGLACRHRFVLTPLLRADAGAAARLRTSVAVELAAGLAVVALAATMSGLPPGAHEQPDWPFAMQPSLSFTEDADLQREVGLALLGLGVAAILVVLALFVRLLRWPALAAAAVIAWFCVPHLDLLLVPATPTNFYTSPTGFDAAGIARGGRLFAENCTACHGSQGKGDGPAAASLDIPPADLTAGHLWEHPDGELFWWLTHGMDSPRGGLAMPGFADRLDVDARWAVIDFIRAQNAGASMRHTGGWTRPVPAPALTARCAGGQEKTLDDLRGQTVLVMAGPPHDMPGITAVFLDDGAPPPCTCVAAGADVRAGYAVVLGVDPAQMQGMGAVIDRQGWLRTRVGPDASASALAAAIRLVARDKPLPAQAGGHHHH
jgi:putative copper export protein/mono/diheme cytochrome c family protein